MTERNQVRRALRGHDGGDARDAEDVALLGRPRLHEFEGRRRHVDASARTRDAVRFGLGADVDHVRLAFLIKMREFRHWASLRLMYEKGSL